MHTYSRKLDLVTDLGNVSMTPFGQNTSIMKVERKGEIRRRHSFHKQIKKRGTPTARLSGVRF